MEQTFYDKICDEATYHLRELLRIDTTNPPGNEIAAAQYIAKVLAAEDIDSLVLESAPFRGNVVARLRGSGEKKPLLLFSHLDVVAAEVDKWTHPPFGGEIADGFIWGRGALDMKGMTAMELAAFLTLKRLAVPLKRDVILAAVADEEEGGRWGAEWLVTNKPELLDAEYALNEMGGFSMHVGSTVYYPVQVAEKGRLWLRMKAKGDPAHGSLPPENSSVVKAADAVLKLARKGLPLHATEVQKAFLRSLAATQPFYKAIALRGLTVPGLSRILLRTMANRDVARAFYAQLHNTVNPTCLKAGSKVNVVPSESDVMLDCRLLPGQTRESVLAEIKAVVGEEFEFEELQWGAPLEAPRDADVIGCIESVLLRYDPKAIVIPYLLTAYTDAGHLAKLGIKTYGFSPVKLRPTDSFMKIIHGHDERISEEGFRFGTKVFFEVVKEFCS